jgi:hypothetical protein
MELGRSRRTLLMTMMLLLRSAARASAARLRGQANKICRARQSTRKVAFRLGAVNQEFPDAKVG